MKGSQKANAQKHEAELPRAPEQKKNHLPIMEITRSDRRLAILQQKQADDLAVTWLAAGELLYHGVRFRDPMIDDSPVPQKSCSFA